ncbi:NAD(P)-binding protein [Roridomyces roridus]|uniref:NAD(P)-binding protein n=1 Tax=Roridomyces roridus TaxID=1738132 RepID=A0AAD7C8P4_9AGAR|nr:NAD(P)-binding protein [Roridomyces roridus]
MGANSSSLLRQFIPPKAKWSVDEIPDLTGQVMLVTGGNSGIGRETVKVLLQHNAKIYIAGRSESKCMEVIKSLETETGRRAEFLQLDLSDLSSVKTAAEEFARRESKLNVLFNNAGVMWPPADMLTAQKIDLAFGTNTLGPFYFTKLLLPTLIATAASTGTKVRIINTASIAGQMHPQADGINYNTLLDGPARRKKDKVYIYGQSKLGNIIVSNELARRYADQGIVSISLNPGNLRSELARHETNPIVHWIVYWVVSYPVPLGALTQLWAGTMKAAEGLNGGYLLPWARVGAMPPAAADPAAGKALWTWLEEQVERFEAGN